MAKKSSQEKYNSKETEAFIHEWNLKVMKKEFDSGDARALYEAQILCNVFKFPTPDWVTDAEKNILEKGELPGKKLPTPAKIKQKKRKVFLWAVLSVAFDFGKGYQLPKKYEGGDDCIDVALGILKVIRQTDKKLGPPFEEILEETNNLKPTYNVLEKETKFIDLDENRFLISRKKMRLLSLLWELGYLLPKKK